MTCELAFKIAATCAAVALVTGYLVAALGEVYGPDDHLTYGTACVFLLALVSALGFGVIGVWRL